MNIGSLTLEREANLAPLTSWLVGGPAEYLAQPQTVEQLKEALEWARRESKTVTVLSGGTNVLIADEGIRGLVICLRKFTGLMATEQNGRLVIECLAGTSKSELLKTFLKHKLEPALFLAGLPGDVGGGVAMNAGIGEAITPREFVEITDWVEVLRWNDQHSSLELKRFAADNLEWRYRHCRGWQPGIITRVGISCAYQPSPDVLSRVRQANQVRLSKQPLDLPSCGSVFVNPPGHKSGQLIEAAGLKGYTVGGAQVSKKHANFIVNLENATAREIHSVITFVQKTVLDRSGIELKTEVVYLGEWP